MALATLPSRCQASPGNARIWVSLRGKLIFWGKRALLGTEPGEGALGGFSVAHEMAQLHRKRVVMDFLRLMGSGGALPRTRAVHSKERRGKPHGDHAALVPQEERDHSSCLWQCLVGDSKITFRLARRFDSQIQLLWCQQMWGISGNVISPSFLLEMGLKKKLSSSLPSQQQLRGF